MIYFIILFLLLFCIYYYDYAKNKRLYNVSYWAFFVILLLVAGLRYRIGNDSIMYERYYEFMPTIPELFAYNFSSIRFEPGFIVFASIPRTITPDFTLMQFFQAGVVLSVIFWFILKNTRNRFFCLTLFYFIQYLYFTTEIMRESLAVACFLLAWPYFRDGKWLKYYLLAGLATFFHTTAFFLLVLPVVCVPGIREMFRFGYRTLFISIGILAVAFLINLKFYDLIMAISVSERMTERAATYSKEEIGSSLLNIVGVIDIFIRYPLYAVLTLWIYNTNVKYKKPKGKKLRNALRLETMVVCLVYISMVALIIPIFLRFNNYFCMFFYAMLANVYLGNIDFKKKVYKLKPIYWNLILVPMIVFNLYVYIRPVNKSQTLPLYVKYFPYNTRLNPERDMDREAIFKFYGVR